MKQYACVVVYTLLEQLKYILCYKVIFNRSIQIRKKVMMAAFVGIMLLQVVVMHYEDSSWVDIINLLVGILIPVIIIDKFDFKKLLIYPIIFFGTSLVDSGIAILFASILDLPESRVVGSYDIAILCILVTISILALYYKLVVKGKENYNSLIYSRTQYIVIMFGIISSAIIIGCSQWLMKEGDIPYSVRIVCRLAISVVSIVLVIISVWQGRVLVKESEFKQKQLTYENYLKLQEERIYRLNSMDESMRRFRHDLHGHIIALKFLAEKTQDSNLITYINDMEENSEEYRVKKYTGHNAVDAVLNERFEVAQSKEIDIQWKGTLIPQGNISIFDLCTIFSNILTNAIEACEKVEEKKIIVVKISTYEDKLYIQILNTCANRENQREIQELETTKGDNINHGLGIKSVRETIKKYDGRLKFSVENNWFETEIML